MSKHRGGNDFSLPWRIFKGGSREEIALEFYLEKWVGMWQFSGGKRIPSQENKQYFRGVQVHVVPEMWIRTGKRTQWPQLYWRNNLLFSFTILLIATLLQIHNLVSFDISIHQCYDHLLSNVAIFVFNNGFWNILFLSISSHTFDKMTWPYLLSSRHSTLHSLTKNINIPIGAHNYIILPNDTKTKQNKMPNTSFDFRSCYQPS